jgi:hypothetical protein
MVEILEAATEYAFLHFGGYLRDIKAMQWNQKKNY